MKTDAIRMLSFLAAAGILVPMLAVAQDNPFFAPYGTPWEVPAFGKIKIEHYMPAFDAGIAEQKKEVAAIHDSIFSRSSRYG